MVFGWLVGIGFVVGLSAYLRSRFLKPTFSVDPFDLVECCFAGSLGAGALYLPICALWPELLVHHVQANGAIFVLPKGVHCDMEDLHRIEIAAAGLVSFCAGFLVIKRECDK